MQMSIVKTNLNLTGVQVPATHQFNSTTIPKEIVELVFSSLAISFEYSPTIALISKSWNIFCYSEKKKALLKIIGDHVSQINGVDLRPNLKLCCINELTSPTNFMLATLIKEKANRKEVDFVNKTVKPEIFVKYASLESQIALHKLEKNFIIHADNITVATQKAMLLISKEPQSKMRFIPKNANAILKRLEFSTNPSAILLSELLKQKPNDHRPIL
ncbi:MAG: hypothetical protein H0U49_02285 [Parachlamydiaceae bacterium]|nr:hypothetical protein [Parachlamydiaceae bacterium]